VRGLRDHDEFERRPLPQHSRGCSEELLSSPVKIPGCSRTRLAVSWAGSRNSSRLWRLKRTMILLRESCSGNSSRGLYRRRRRSSMGLLRSLWICADSTSERSIWPLFRLHGSRRTSFEHTEYLDASFFKRHMEGWQYFV